MADGEVGVVGKKREDLKPVPWEPTPVFLPGESHGQRSLMGYSPRGRSEPDTTERLGVHTRMTPVFSKK